MKKMHRVMIVSLILVMIFTLTGCGGQKKTAADENIQCGIMNWQEPSDLEIFPKPALGEWKEYNSLTTLILDLNAGNIEYGQDSGSDEKTIKRTS